MEDLRQLQAQQSENVIRHSLSRQVGVETPLLQTFFFSVLPAVILATMACWAVSAYVDLPRWVYPCFVISIGAIALNRGGKRRVEKQDGWIERLVKTLESAFQVDINGDGEIDEQPAEHKGERIAYILREILERHYLEGQKTDRDTFEKLGLCTQPEWNTANDILKRLGIKGPRDFLMDSYAKALAAYRMRVIVFPEVIHVRHLNDNGTEIIHL